MMNLSKDDILNAVYKECSICGHCGKKECAYKAMRALPERIKSEDLLTAIESLFKGGE